MSKPVAESFEIEDQGRYDSARVDILAAIAEGTYEHPTSQQEIAERHGLGIINVQQLTFGMIGSREITWESDPATGINRRVLTEAGEQRLAELLAQTGDSC